MIHRSLIKLILAGLLLTSCSAEPAANANKTSEFKPPAPTLLPSEVGQLIEYLTQNEEKTWQLMSRKIKGQPVDLGCHIDDKLIFRRDNLVTVDIGTIKCDPRDPAEITQQARWQLTDQRSLLLITFDAPPYELKILELDANKMVLESFRDPRVVAEETYLALDTGPKPEPSPSASARPNSRLNQALGLEP